MAQVCVSPPTSSRYYIKIDYPAGLFGIGDIRREFALGLQFGCSGVRCARPVHGKPGVRRSSDANGFTCP